MDGDAHKRRGRNKAFEQTHREMIGTAVRLISEKGADALSIAAIAREMKVDRTTVYYHFSSRDDLLQAVTSWSIDQLAKGMDSSVSYMVRAEQITRFVLENPELIKLWIDGFVSGSDIRDSYSRWDELVDGLKQSFAEPGGLGDVDAEVYAVKLLSAAIIGPRVFARSIRPGEPVETIVAKFLREEERVLGRDGLQD